MELLDPGDQTGEVLLRGFFLKVDSACASCFSRVWSYFKLQLLPGSLKPGVFGKLDFF